MYIYTVIVTHILFLTNLHELMQVNFGVKCAKFIPYAIQ